MPTNDQIDAVKPKNTCISPDKMYEKRNSYWLSTNVFFWATITKCGNSLMDTASCDDDRRVDGDSGVDLIHGTTNVLVVLLPMPSTGSCSGLLPYPLIDIFECL
ncbi:hypothetical protein AB6A40_004290 [Gnathostoma spinigerum]|uniref:Uncharacterized protein n=1 Tax=Gnathostoma spinigerum TaxID=75299 RepID=A0ABD6EED4_9BILA